MFTTLVGVAVMGFGGDLSAGQVREWFSAEQLSRGVNPRGSGLTLTFAAEVEGAESVEVLADGQPRLKLREVADDLFAGQITLADGEAFLASYLVDGKTVLRAGIEVEAYALRPHLVLPEGGYRGTFQSKGSLKSVIYAGTDREWWVYYPPGYDQTTEYPVLVGQDGQWDRNWMATTLDNLIAAGRIPPTVGVFVQHGNFEGNRSNRNPEYDTLNGDYARFIETEIFPLVEKDLRLTKDPAKRAITGMSSGGICAFTAAWERSDLFGNVLSFIGSYTALSREGIEKSGVTYPAKIRREDKKPIRVWLQDGKNDLNNPYGNWWLANLEMKSALEWKGYEVVWVPGNGFHNTNHARAVFDEALVWWLNPGR